MPDLQHLEVDQWVPMSPSPTPTDVTAFKVHSFEVNRWLLWSKPDSTWAWQLTRTDGGGTRLRSPSGFPRKAMTSRPILPRT